MFSYQKFPVLQFSSYFESFKNTFSKFEVTYLTTATKITWFIEKVPVVSKRNKGFFGSRRSRIKDPSWLN